MTTHATPPVLGIPGATADLSARLSDGLARVDALLTQVVDHDDPFIAAASGHLVAAGGKRFRPLLTLLAAELGEGINDDVVAAAAGVELTHLASLYHDDVMDEASVRRGVASVNAAYDNSTAILVGDLLFGKASELVAGLGAEAVLIQAQTFVRLCNGQIRDDRPCPEGVDPVDYYLGVLADKTGVLIATAGRYGVMFSGGSPESVEIMRVLRREARHRLPARRRPHRHRVRRRRQRQDPRHRPARGRRHPGRAAFRATADPADASDARLLELLDGDLTDDDAALAEALGLLRAHPALAVARDETYAVAREAQALLDPLPDSDAKAALQALALSVVDRVG